MTTMSSWGQDTPPDASTAVLLVADSIIIDAPIEKVWSILLDFPGYEKWNAFIRKQTIIDGPTGKPLPEASQGASVGAVIHMSPVHIPPTFRDSSRLWPWEKNSTTCEISYLDNESYRIAWRSYNTSSWLLEAERWQWLTKTADGKVKYESYEVFRGVLAYIVKVFVAAGVRKGIRAVCEGLKHEAEKDNQE